jgi:hypothetical protein
MKILNSTREGMFEGVGEENYWRSWSPQADSLSAGRYVTTCRRNQSWPRNSHVQFNSCPHLEAGIRKPMAQRRREGHFPERTWPLAEEMRVGEI